MVAVRAGAADVVQLLLSHNVDVNAQSKPGEVPVFACQRQTLVSKGIGIVRGGWPERGERSPIGGAKTSVICNTCRQFSIDTVIGGSRSGYEQPMQMASRRC